MLTATYPKHCVPVMGAHDCRYAHAYLIMKDFLLRYSTQALLAILVAIGGYIYSEVRDTSKALAAQSAILSASAVRFENQAVALADIKVAIEKLNTENRSQEIELAKLNLMILSHLKVSPTP